MKEKTINFVHYTEKGYKCRPNDRFGSILSYIGSHLLTAGLVIILICSVPLTH